MDFDGNFITDDFIRHALLSPRQSEKQEQDINTVSTQFNQGRYDLSINDLKANIEFSPMKNKKWSLKHISQKIVEELNKRPMQVQELTKLFLEEMINSNYCLDLEKDKQNLKRRIYDAVNVLTAIQIIVKDSQDNLSKGKGPQLNRKKSDLMKRKLELQKSKVEKGEYATSLVHEIDTYKDIIKYQKSMARSTQDQIHINFPFTAIYTSLLGKNNEEVVIEHNLTKQIFKMQSKNPFRTYNEVEMAQKLLSIKLNQQQ